MSELLGLAEKFVRLSAEVEETRRAMLACLTNGAGEMPQAPFVTARSKPGIHPNAKAAEAEARIVELLKERPHMTTSGIAKATNAAGSTTALRLQRLKARGEIVGGGVDGYSAPP